MFLTPPWSIDKGAFFCFGGFIINKKHLFNHDALSKNSY